MVLILRGKRISKSVLILICFCGLSLFNLIQFSHRACMIIESAEENVIIGSYQSTLLPSPTHGKTFAELNISDSESPKIWIHVSNFAEGMSKWRHSVLQQHKTVVLSDYQSHVEEKFLLFFPHSGFSNQFHGLQRAAQIAYASKRTLVLPPVLPHHTFNRDFLKYPKFEAKVGGQCDKEHWIHYYLKLSHELVDYPSFQALFNFDSISKNTNGLKVIDIQEFSRLEHANVTDFSKWCVEIHEEDSRCNYPKSSTLYFEVLEALQGKCRETQIAALGSGFQIRAPPNATKIANFNVIHSYFDQIELSHDLLKLLHSIYKKLPHNYNGAHIRVNDRIACEPKDSCEETCNEEETKGAFVDFMKDIDSTKNTSHILLGYGNEVVVKCFKYFAKENYNITTVFDTVENDPRLLHMLEAIKSEKDTVYLLLDQILIGLAENVNLKVNFGRKFRSTYQAEIKKWHNRRHDILASIK